MKLALLAFTPQGQRQADRLQELLPEIQWLRYEKEKCSAAAFVAEQFSLCQGLLWIGAVGIAVRLIAPHLRSKGSDPAVVVIDEQGRFAISLLSGHIGGGNRLTLRLAALLGAQPVITTATDLNRLFAVDLWASDHDCAISDLGKIKEVSGALLRGEPVGLESDFPIAGPLPEGLTLQKCPAVGIRLSFYQKDRDPFENTLWLVPKILTLGVGCRRDIPPDQFRVFIDGLLDKEKISPLAIRQVASISLKAQEPCILAYCQSRGLPFLSFSPEELMEVPGDFSSSSFVQKTTGADNVCERSAMAASGKQLQKPAFPSRLLVPKQAGQGITAAIAAADWRCEF